jgi:hypothetical protein
MARIGWWTLVAQLLLALPASAQEPRLAGRLPEALRGEVEALLDSARTLGLPTEPLIDRALEGASKGAEATRILAAVRRLAADLASAQTALGPGSADAEVGAGAAALRAGARPDDLTRLREQRPGQSVTVAAAVLTDLVALGVPPDTATAAVLALAGGADDAAFLAFRRNVERDVALGATPIAALTARLMTGDLTTEAGPRRPRKP